MVSTNWVEIIISVTNGMIGNKKYMIKTHLPPFFSSNIQLIVYIYQWVVQVIRKLDGETVLCAIKNSFIYI